MQEIHYSAEQVAENLRDDLDFFAYALIPQETTTPYPDFYKKVWAYILTQLHEIGPQETFRFALGLPRGHVKTTIMKLLVCYLILHDYDISFILIVCSTEPLAENFLSDISEMLASEIVTQIYGSWQVSLTRDTRKIKTANFGNRQIILGAIGAQTSTRGLNIQNRRPQLILCDDSQTKENDESDAERKKLLTWLLGTLFKSRSKTSKSALIYLGNMYSTDCILYQLSKNPHWSSLITGAILADGTALWPELNSLEALIEEYNHDNEMGEGAIWFAEVQNDPIGSGSGLLEHGQMVPTPVDEELFELSNFPVRYVCIDPAGYNKTADDNVIAGFCIMEDEKIGTFYLENGKFDPEKVIKITISACQKYSIPIIFVESNAYQSTLAFWMTKYLTELELDKIIKVVPLNSGSQSKLQRIRAFVKILVTGGWKLITKKIHNAVTFQIYSFKITKQNNTDDILDVHAMGLKALNEHKNTIYQSQYASTVLDRKNLPGIIPNNSILDKLKFNRRRR